MNYVDFLEGKYVDKSTISKIINAVNNDKIDDINEKIVKIYEILNYAGLSDEQIEIFLSNNTSKLKWDFSEFIKIAYVLGSIGLVDEMFEVKHAGHIQNLSNYKRIFVRNILAEKSGRYFLRTNSRTTACSFLTTREAEAYGAKYNLNSDAMIAYNVSISSDKELEDFYNSCMEDTIDDIIDKKSKKFYIKYLANKYKKSANKKSM